MTDSSVFRLRGTVTSGMFPNERAFNVRSHDGQTYVVLVPASFVEERDGKPTILVHRLDSARGISLVSMPGEALDSRTVSVPDSDLIPA